MVYTIYGKQTDIDDIITESLASALVRAGELRDMRIDDAFEARKYDLSSDEYIECLDADDHLKGVYSIRGFIEQFGIEPHFNTITPAEAERLVNMSPEEKEFIVMHIPDNVILAELARRMKQYRDFAEKIGEANAELRIFI